MELLPEAHLVPRRPIVRARAAVARARVAARRAWHRVAQQALVLALTAVAFTGMLALMIVLAQHAVVVGQRGVALRPIAPPPIYFMHAPSPKDVGAALASLRPAQLEFEAAPRGLAGK